MTSSRIPPRQDDSTNDRPRLSRQLWQRYPAGFGKRVLDGLGQSPEHPLDALALALPLGMGLTALATLGLGELGWLNWVGLSILLAVLIELGIVS